jgi:hypothetical protein
MARESRSERDANETGFRSYPIRQHYKPAPRANKAVRVCVWFAVFAVIGVLIAKGI